MICQLQSNCQKSFVLLMVLQVGQAFGAMLPKIANASGYDTAVRWNACPAWAKSVRHKIDVVASSHHQLLFLDNVKAGSSSIRALLADVLGTGWGGHGPCKQGNLNLTLRHRSPSGICGRTSSMDLLQEDVSSFFKFSFVRDPLAKFESGVRQYWSMDKRAAKLTADQILMKQLKLPKGQWLNEHLESSSWRLSAHFTEDPAKLDFIGKLENMKEDWASAVNAIRSLTPDQVRRLNLLGHHNSRPEDHRSKLSPQAVRHMCQSEQYGSEWSCFGYPLPEPCK